MFFSVPVLGFGAVFVDAPDSSAAVEAVQRFLNRNQVRLEEGSSIGSAIAVSKGEVNNDLLLDGNGAPIAPEQPEESVTGQEPVEVVAARGIDNVRSGSRGDSGSAPLHTAPRLFRFDVPVIGDLFVVADNAGEAQTAGEAHLAQFAESVGIADGFKLGSAENLAVDDLPMSADPNFVIDSSGLIRDDLLGGSGSGDIGFQDGVARRGRPNAGRSGTVSLVAQNAASNPLFIGKVVDQNGVIRFVRSNSSDTSQVRAILESMFGASATIQVVSTPEFLLETDSDFVISLQQSGFPDLDSFVQSLELVTEIDADSDDDNPGTDDDDETPPELDGELPFDVQTFPFASFQNAVSALGIDPEGVLGSTVNQRFNALAPAAQIGSLTGTVEPVGQDPGALEQFFRDRFGDLDVAAETFRDLLAGRTGSDLSADQLLSFQALQNPDIATGRGRGDAADVFRLARAAAADRFGSFVASRLLPSNTRLFRELERVLAQGDPSTDFLEFARQQNLLPV